MSAPPFHSHRSPVYGLRGMVATTQPAAVLAGVDALRRGGNAFDAAIAAAAVLAVTEPTGCGLGGDCFALCYESGRILGLNGSGRAPSGLDLALLAAQGMPELPRFHAHTVTVPGVVAGWCDLAKRLGTRPLHELLAPAIELARDGYAVAPKTAYFWARSVEPQLVPGNAVSLLPGGRAPRAGERVRNLALVQTLERIALGGADAFYRGPVAAAIAQAVQRAGGTMTEDDLAAHTSTWDEPIATEFGGARIYECAPNGQGLVALIALNVLAELGGPGHLGGPGSAERAHLVIEALRLAFADARRVVADPALVRVPVAELLSREHARSRAALVHRDRATVDRALRPHASSDTVYLSVVDRAGNACSFIQSNYMGVGTGIEPEGTGFTLQNRGHNFSLEPGHPNALAPGKRPYHTIIPGLATTADGALLASFGVMGGFMQPQGHVQVVLAMLEDGLDAQAALDRPRMCVGVDGDVAVEDGTDEHVIARLAAMGHAVRVVSGHDRALFGRGQIITCDADGVLCGGSDLRGDGCALGV